MIMIHLFWLTYDFLASKNIGTGGTGKTRPLAKLGHLHFLRAFFHWQNSATRLIFEKYLQVFTPLLDKILQET